MELGTNNCKNAKLLFIIAIEQQHTTIVVVIIVKRNRLQLSQEVFSKKSIKDFYKAIILMQPPFLVGLTGLSGSGKTTFLHRLQEAFSEEDLCVISQDNYYKPKENQTQDAKGIHNFDLPTSIDRVAFHQDIVQLLEGKVVKREEYTFNNELVTPKILTFEPKPIILIEGLFIYYYEEIRNLLNLKLFLHAQETTAFTRRIKRDRLERNYPLEDVLYRYQKHVLPSYEQYIKPFQKEADIVVNNHRDFEMGLKVVTAYLNSLLK